jgi:hypothetical protein
MVLIVLYLDAVASELLRPLLPQTSPHGLPLAAKGEGAWVLDLRKASARQPGLRMSSSCGIQTSEDQRDAVLCDPIDLSSSNLSPANLGLEDDIGYAWDQRHSRPFMPSYKFIIVSIIEAPS